MNSTETQEPTPYDPASKTPSSAEEITPTPAENFEVPAPVEAALPGDEQAPAAAETGGEVEEIRPDEEIEVEGAQPSTGEEPEGARVVTDEEVEALRPPPTHGLIGRIFAFLFNPETRFGRFMRRFMRGLAVVLVLFGLGFLTATLVLYRPASQALEAARADLAAVRLQAEESVIQAQRATAEQAASSTRVDEVELVLQSRDNRIQLLVLQNQIAEARLELANRNGPVVLQLLNSARETLKPLLPVLRPLDSALVDSLDMRLNLATNELANDPATAQADLELLASALELLDKKMGN